jgi:hypothetical protein
VRAARVFVAAVPAGGENAGRVSRSRLRGQSLSRDRDEFPGRQAVGLLFQQPVGQVGIVLLQDPLRDHRADHLGGGTAAQALGQRHGDTIRPLGGGTPDQGLSPGKPGHRRLLY